MCPLDINGKVTSLSHLVFFTATLVIIERLFLSVLHKTLSCGYSLEKPSYVLLMSTTTCYFMEVYTKLYVYSRRKPHKKQTLIIN